MISFEEALVFSQGAELPVELFNFWPAEADFVWSTGRWCEIAFDFADTGRRVEHSDLILDLDAFKREESVSTIALYLNGCRVGTAQIRTRTTLVVNFATALLKPSGNVLIIDTLDSCSPSDLGLQDGRILGVQLFSVQIRPC